MILILLLLKVCLSDFIDLLNFTLLHFHLDITDSFFMVIAAARSKGFQKLSPENKVQIGSSLWLLSTKVNNCIFICQINETDRYWSIVFCMYVAIFTFCSSFPPTASLCVSYRETCAAIACMDAAATHYLGFRSQGSWRGERHPTPPRPLPQPDTPLSTPCRGRTWSRRRTVASQSRFISDLQTLQLGHNVSNKYTLTQDELNVSWWIMSF